jgi:Na+-driven multidrug efflux pump
VLETELNGAGDTWTPTYLNFFVFWLFEIPAAYLLAYHFGMGPEGVFWAITIAFWLLAISSAILLKRGKWKMKKVCGAPGFRKWSRRHPASIARRSNFGGI